jgi:hypothetical protein
MLAKSKFCRLEPAHWRWQADFVELPHTLPP